MKRIGPMITALGLFLCAQLALADWTPAKRITWNSGGSGEPDIAVDTSDNLHLVWLDGTPGNDEIYYRKSTDGGATWTPAKRLTWTSSGSGSPALAVDPSDNLHIVWQDSTPGNAEIYYANSTDGGNTWTMSKRLSWTSGQSYGPTIAVDSSGNIHVVWEDYTPGNVEIYYRKSTDGGSSWSPRKRITWTSGGSCYPVIAVDSSSHLHVVWWDDTPGSWIWEIYYKKSTDGGASWTTGKRLTWNAGYSIHPAIVVDFYDNLHVIWEDSTPGNNEVYYKKSTDGGITWTTGRNLTGTSGDSLFPAISVNSSDSLYAVCHDITPGNWEIYCLNSTDGGATWTSSQRITWTLGDSERPAIAVDSSGNPHVVWQDDTPGNREIYYRKFIK